MEIWVTNYNGRPIAAHRTKTEAWNAIHLMLYADRERKGWYQWERAGDGWLVRWDSEPPEITHHYCVTGLILGN